MDKEQLIWLQGTLSAQAYMLELLLAKLVMDEPDKAKALDLISATAQDALRFRMLVPSLEPQPNDHLRVQAAAVRCVADICDRARAAMGIPEAGAGDGA